MLGSGGWGESSGLRPHPLLDAPEEAHGEDHGEKLQKREKSRNWLIRLGPLWAAWSTPGKGHLPPGQSECLSLLAHSSHRDS